MRFWFLTCVALATAAVAAPKKPTVVVDANPALTKVVTKSLAAKYAVVPASKRTSGEVAFINVTAEGKQLKFTVLSAADGAELGVVSVAGTLKKPPKTLPKPKVNALLTALSAAKATAPKPEPAKTEPEPQKTEPAKTEPAPTEPAKEEPAPEPAKTEVAKAEPVKSEPAKTEPAPARTEPRPAEPADEETAAPKRSAHYAFRASLAGGIFNRNLYPQGSVDVPARPFGANHPATGTFNAELSVFPGAAFTSGFLAHLGAFISLDLGMNPRLRVDSRAPYIVTGSLSRLRFGAQGRLPIGDNVSFVLHAGYSRHTLFTYVPEDKSLDTPDMLFNGFRGGFQFRWHIAGPVELELGGAAQYVASIGTLRSGFPNARAFALDAGLALAIELVPHVRLRVSGEWQRYFISLNPDGDSPYQTRAAGDQFVWVTGGLQWSM